MSEPRLHNLGIILNGVTGRMGTNQHLLRSILPIIRQGGVLLPSGDRIMPVPLLAGRNPQKLAALSAQADGLKWTTDLDTALADPAYPVYFDAQGTLPRAAAVARAIRAGRHIYCEKPSAATTREAYALYRVAQQAGVRHGVVQDKLWLPGFRKLKALLDRGFFGRVLSVRGEFGYWVFEGDTVPGQRPSWNYRSEEGGGIILDMLCHWRYLIDNLFGAVKSVNCLGATHIGRRIDEAAVNTPAPPTMPPTPPSSWPTA